MPIFTTLFPKLAVWTTMLLFVAGCAHQYQGTANDLAPLPSQWRYPPETFSAQTSWRAFVDAPELEELLQNALKSNTELHLKRKDLEIAREQLQQAKMSFWPELSVGLSAGRSGIESAAASNQFELSAQSSWEVNLWGQLSDAKRARAFAYSAELARYEQLKRQVVRQVADAWLSLVEAQQLLNLYEYRLNILEQNLRTIESGYRSGLNTALEVYLTRNDVEDGKAAYAQQRQAADDSKRQLALLVGDYPGLAFPVYDQFPRTNEVLPPNLPAEVLARRTDLQAAWLDILAQDAQLAVAYKARFPSLRLTASSGYSSAELGDLLDSDLFWNVGASLLQPILASGRLKSEENIARLRLQQRERQYRETVHQAFAQVESTLQNQDSLDRQFNHIQQSAENAKLAESLSFDQYLKGLVSYATFLEAQRRAIDADIQLIRLSRQRVANRIRLHEVLAGDLDFLSTAEVERPGPE